MDEHTFQTLSAQVSLLTQEVRMDRDHHNQIHQAVDKRVSGMETTVTEIKEAFLKFSGIFVTVIALSAFFGPLLSQIILRFIFK